MIAIPKAKRKFKEGQLVHHRRHDYRGVIVATDERCMADDEWYESNMTQPQRDQPWYHVLVDGSMRTTYVAETNLERDSTGEPVAHPLVAHFFSDFVDGQYVRNEREWKGWGD